MLKNVKLPFVLLYLILVSTMVNTRSQDEAEAKQDEDEDHVKQTEDEELDEEEVKPEKKIETIKLETTTEEVFIITDIPQDDILEALNIDVGVYSTQTYRYVNSQYSNRKEDERCLDDYLKCLSSQVVMGVACGYNNQKWYGRYTFNSYCDLYYDNCIRGWRYWRLYKYGECPPY